VSPSDTHEGSSGPKRTREDRLLPKMQCNPDQSLAFRLAAPAQIRGHDEVLSGEPIGKQP